MNTNSSKSTREARLLLSRTLAAPTMAIDIEHQTAASCDSAQASSDATTTSAATDPSVAASSNKATADPTQERALFCESLTHAYKQNGKRFLGPKDQRFMHGWGYTGPLVKPKTLWSSSSKPRKDHDAPAWLTASEYEDVDEVMAAKVKQLAHLMRMSRRTCIYSGAGISASVVGQAALSGTNKVGWLSKTEAQPTPTHHALAALANAGLIHGWVQQNHDGLPQKAGFPQEAICEVHGSWYDPANPVVKYSGSLRDHECAWMEAEAQAADLVLVMGTSLGGLNADQVATECALRALGDTDAETIRPSLGSVLINLQQTAEDGKMTLKLHGRSDTVLAALLSELGLPCVPALARQARWAPVDCALVPYDKRGVRLPEGSTAPKMWLDLRPGAQVKITSRHNHQGAKQPNTIHIGSRKGQTFQKKAIERAGQCPGNGTVTRREEESASYKLNIEGAPMRLGIWWLESAARGGPAFLPLVNQTPAFEGAPDPSRGGAAGGAGSATAATKSKTAAANWGKAKAKAIWK